jgi:hypothetical protein
MALVFTRWYYIYDLYHAQEIYSFMINDENVQGVSSSYDAHHVLTMPEKNSAHLPSVMD